MQPAVLNFRISQSRACVQAVGFIHSGICLDELADLVCLIVGVGNNTRTTQVGEFGPRRTLECSNQDCDPKTDSAHSRQSCLDQRY